MTVNEGAPRTMLGQLLRERRQTAEEFCEELERFARDHNETGTLSVRHLQRLIAGRREDGRPLGELRPATRRLLERMLGRSIDELLGLPVGDVDPSMGSDTADELRARLAVSRRVDAGVVDLFQQQLDITRVIDGRLGAASLVRQVGVQIDTMVERLEFTVNDTTRRALGRVIVDACTLAGWQSLDQGRVTESWQYYERARCAALQAHSSALLAYAQAGQSVVLMEIGDNASAVELTENALRESSSAPRLLQSWLHAAHGEACAAAGMKKACMESFDHAASLMPAAPHDTGDARYLVFDSTQLDRWRGNALAKLNEWEAVAILESALSRLDDRLVRAETSLRIDLVSILRSSGRHDEAASHERRARTLAGQIGSRRLMRRLSPLGRG